MLVRLIATHPRIVRVVPGIALLGMVLLLMPALIGNITHVQAWKQLATCLQDEGKVLKSTDFFYMLWSGNQQQPVVCSPVEHVAGNEDIVVIAAWVGTTPVANTTLQRITPTWKRNVFLWRDSGWDEAMLVADSVEHPGNNPSQMLAQMALWYRDTHMEQALYFAQRALAGAPDSEVARLLTFSFGGARDRDELADIVSLRRSIAAALPTYTDNYADWFQMMLQYQEWDAAEEPCNLLRRYADADHRPLAETCRAMIAFYQGEYATAQDILEPLSAQMPTESLVWDWLGKTTRELGNYEASEQAFTQALAHEQEGTRLLALYWQRAEVQAAQGKTYQARESYQMALRHTTDPDTRARLTTEINQLP